jgi:hypothetical protein
MNNPTTTTDQESGYLPDSYEKSIVCELHSRNALHAMNEAFCNLPLNQNDQVLFQATINVLKAHLDTYETQSRRLEHVYYNRLRDRASGQTTTP